MVGETNRAPFDLPEAEGELVGGFHTEYSSLKFALFFLAEYINMFTVAALATTLFLGGWQAPWPLGGPIWAGANDGWWPVLWFVGKLWVFMFVFIWLRGTLPRLRYDQFMKLGWKVLIPLSLLWIVVVATVRAVSNEVRVRPPGHPDLGWRHAGGAARPQLRSGTVSRRQRESARRRRPVEFDAVRRRLPCSAAAWTGSPAPVAVAATSGEPVGQGGARCLASSTRSRDSVSPSARCSEGDH